MTDRLKAWLGRADEARTLPMEDALAALRALRAVVEECKNPGVVDVTGEEFAAYIRRVIEEEVFGAD
jgi:hypothetical protein